ncbi:MAG: cyclase family protein [Proteobacteria bacterium]|nr:cyclase family protein [Pseudomonadota bacterium]
MRLFIVAMLTSTILLLPIGGHAADIPKSEFGANDEVGALNRLTDTSRLQILSRITGGKVYDLSVDTFPGMPGLVDLGMGDPDFHMWMTHTPEGLVIEGISPGDVEGDFALYDDAVIMSNHTGTHIDALNHAGYGEKIFNQFSSADHLGNKGWRIAGADKIPPIITRGVLIDVAMQKGLDVLVDSYEITVDDIVAALKRQTVSIESGDAVFIRTGRMRHWPKPDLFVPREPGIGIAAAKWLVEQGAVLIGADNIAVERIPVTGSPVHAFVFAEAGVCLVELVWLEELAEDKIYEFALIAAPIKIRGATGSPMRPIALPIGPR